MNQHPTTATPSLRTGDLSARPSAPIDDAALKEPEPLEAEDKYDPAKIPCTD